MINTKIKTALMALALLGLLSSITQAATYTRVVTNCSDSASVGGSLRWALTGLSNNTEIIFDITTGEAGYSTGEAYPGLVTNEAGSNKWYRIIINSALPVITQSNIYIHGSTQAREANNSKGPKVEVCCADSGSYYGFEVTGGNCTIEGLTINKFSAFTYAGIYLVHSSNTAVRGCYLGTTATGEGAKANYYGIMLSSCSYITIGGSTEAERNLISGNVMYGIYLSSITNSEIKGNYIGLASTGAALGNQNDGIIVYDSSHNIIGGNTTFEGNYICDNAVSGPGGVVIYSSPINEIKNNFVGVGLDGTSDHHNGGWLGIYTEGSNDISIEGNVIAWHFYGIYVNSGDRCRLSGNKLGTSVDGMQDCGNYYGMVLSGSSGSILGGATGGERNLISGNDAEGLQLADSSSSEIKGNYIGVAADGVTPLPNEWYGAVIYDCSGLILGGATGGERNLISGNNGTGLLIDNVTASEIKGNYIGVAADGVTPLPNQGYGIHAMDDCSNSSLGEGNVIACNTSDGIHVDSSGSQVLITRNSMQANAGKGILLEDGANYGISYPVISRAWYFPSSGKTLIAGAAASQALVEVFRTETTPGPDQQGEGQIYLGTSTANGSGRWIFETTALATGEQVTATATKYGSPGYTSEFALNGTVELGRPTVEVISPSGGEKWKGGSTQDITFICLDEAGIQPDSANLYYSTGEGTAWLTIATGQATDSAYSWHPLPSISTSEARVRVTVENNNSIILTNESSAVFTIDSIPPTVEVGQPNGGETLTGNTIYAITWEAADNITSPGSIEVNIYYTANNGASWNFITQEANTGSYNWRVHNINTTLARISIEALDQCGNIASDESDSNFTINASPPTVEVFSPNGGERWKGGSSHDLIFTCADESGIKPNSANFYYSTGEGTAWLTIATGQATDSAYTWFPLPSISTNEARVRVTVQNNNDLTGTDESDGVFTIDSIPPTVEVGQPNGGETLTGNNIYAITWEATDNITSQGSIEVNIYYTANNGASWNFITQEANTGSYNWTVPNIDTTQARISIEAWDECGNMSTAESNAVFAINSSLTRAIVHNCSDAMIPGSLRYVLTNAEAAGGNCEIIFDITTQEAGYSTGEAYPGLVTSEAAPNTWYRIIANAGLPAITQNYIYIHGSTQTREASNALGPEVEIRGKAGGSGNCTLLGSNCTLEGLATNNVSALAATGIGIFVGTGNCIRGCYIGTTATGEGVPVDSISLGIYSSNNIIGGSSAAERNIIPNGIRTYSSSNNKIKGNYIGYSLTGVPINGAYYGVRMDGDPTNDVSYNIIGGVSTAERNYIYGEVEIRGSNGADHNEIRSNYVGVGLDGETNNGGYHYLSVVNYLTLEANVFAGTVNIRGDSSHASIRGNKFGTNAAGTKPFNRYGYSSGLYLEGSYDVIGGTSEAERNLFSGNWCGLELYASSTEVKGNYFGTDWSGTSSVSNEIGILSDGSYNTIGGLAPGEGNLISGNLIGIYFNLDRYSTIVGNRIGKDSNGNDLGNINYGLYFFLTPMISYVQIGPANEIAYNKVNGIYVGASNSILALITRNSMEKNAGKGIYLQAGANKNISYPVVSSAVKSGLTTTITGTATTGSIVEVFKTEDTPDPSGQGEGKVYLATVTAEGTSWIATAEGLVEGDKVTATATKYDSPGYTSEFALNKILDSTPPTVEVGQPNGGETLTGNTIYAITWEAADNITSPGSIEVNIYYTANNGASWNFITQEANTGSYNWRVPNINTTQARVSIEVWDEGGNIASDESDSNFTIETAPPTVTVISPDGGERWKGGSSQNLTFTCADEYGIQPNSANFYYSTGEGTAWITIATGQATDAAYAWGPIPSISSTEVKVRVTVQNNLNFTGTDESSGVFTIDSTPPAVEVGQPNGGEILAGYNIYTITWEATDDTTSPGSLEVNIYYTTNEGASWNFITHQANTGSYDWPVPNLNTTQARVSIEVWDQCGNIASDESDSDFTINKMRSPPNVVYNCSDAMIPGSLRYVLTSAEAAGGNWEIIFDITTAEAESGYSTGEACPGLVTNEAGSNTWYRIMVNSSQLPTLTKNNIYLHGSTQAREAGNTLGPEIEVRQAAGKSYDGICVTGSNCTVEGLVINGFNQTLGAGVRLEGDSNLVKGCYLGTTASGEAKYGNVRGVQVGESANHNIIGGTPEAERNIISGNDQYGVLINTGASNEVRGNYIGLAADGDAMLANGVDNVVLLDASFIVIDRNVISGSSEAGTNAGIFLQNSGSNRIWGNKIGTDATGLKARGNAWHGIYLTSNSDSNLIGGASSLERNIICGQFFLFNVSCGIFIDSGCDDNQVRGNYIGIAGDGSSPLGNTVGVNINYGNRNTVEANVVSGNGSLGNCGGVRICGGSQNCVYGNKIGTDAGGTVRVPNYYGVVLYTDSQHNIIGGTTEAQRNLISGNSCSGVYISGTTGTDSNEVRGNYIGTAGDGATDLGNSQSGVELYYYGKYNIIGGTAAGQGNVISGNDQYGVYVHGSSTGSNEVVGNRIGTDTTGMSACVNSRYGVYIAENASYDQIGPANLIAHNGNASYRDGIRVNSGSNYILITQNSMEANYGKGIYLATGANQNIPYPVIRSAGWSGGATTITGTAAAGAVVEVFKTEPAPGADNQGEGWIYLGSAEASGLGNWSFTTGSLSAGEKVTATASLFHSPGYTSEFALNGTVEAVPHAPNIVYNCSDAMIPGSLRYVLTSAEAAGGNWEVIFDITTLETGSGYSTGEYSPGLVTNEAGSNAWYRIILNSQLPTIEVSNIYIHGSTQTREAGNALGPEIEIRSASDKSYSGFKITGNYCTVEGLVINAFGEHYVTGEAYPGIHIKGGGFDQIRGCYLGTTANGEAKKPNPIGIYLTDGAHDNLIGGLGAGNKNVISGNSDYGIGMDGGDCENNLIKNNYIGTNQGGSARLGNGSFGVIIAGGKYNKVGGAMAGEGNLISGNENAGVALYYTYIKGLLEIGSSNEVKGNLIGTDLNGMTALANGGEGVYIWDSSYNIIGGNTDTERNIISGNNLYGIMVNAFEGTADGNIIKGNYIGLGQDGITKVRNIYQGVCLSNGCHYNQIGGVAPGEGNVISGNYNEGIAIADSSTNEVKGNLIGTDKTGTLNRGNGSPGVAVYRSSYNQIGPANLIAYNNIGYPTKGGIYVKAGSQYILITQNSMEANYGQGISLEAGANNDIPYPVINAVSYNLGTTTITGTAISGASIEVFKTEDIPDPSGQGEGKVYLTTVTATGTNWIATIEGLAPGSKVTATASLFHSPGYTSEFALNATETPVVTSFTITREGDNPGDDVIISWQTDNPGVFMSLYRLTGEADSEIYTNTKSSWELIIPSTTAVVYIEPAQVGQGFGQAYYKVVPVGISDASFITAEAVGKVNFFLQTYPPTLELFALPLMPFDGDINKVIGKQFVTGSAEVWNYTGSGWGSHYYDGSTWSGSLPGGQMQKDLGYWMKSRTANRTLTFVGRVLSSSETISLNTSTLFFLGNPYPRTVSFEASGLSAIFNVNDQVWQWSNCWKSKNYEGANTWSGTSLPGTLFKHGFWMIKHSAPASWTYTKPY